MGGEDSEMVEVNRRHEGRPTDTRITPEQTKTREGAHIASKQVIIVLATNSGCKQNPKLSGLGLTKTPKGPISLILGFASYMGGGVWGMHGSFILGFAPEAHVQ